MLSIVPHKSRYAKGLLLSALIVVAATGAFVASVSADHQPANKMAVSASGIEFLRNTTAPAANEGPRVILEGALKTSKPTDLVFQVTLECSLWTALAVVGNDAPSQATGRVKVWVTFDSPDPAAGVVGLGPTDTRDPGKIVFCDRTHGMTMSGFDDDEDDHRVDTFLKTRTANAFNWILINAGSGVHTVRVWAELDVSVDEGQGFVEAGVGKRTLVIEPVMLPNDAKL